MHAVLRKLSKVLPGYYCVDESGGNSIQLGAIKYARRVFKEMKFRSSIYALTSPEHEDFAQSTIINSRCQVSDAGLYGAVCGRDVWIAYIVSLTKFVLITTDPGAGRWFCNARALLP